VCFKQNTHTHENLFLLVFPLSTTFSNQVRETIFLHPMIPHRYYSSCFVLFLLVLSTFSVSHSQSQSHWSTKKKFARCKNTNKHYHNRFYNFSIFNSFILISMDSAIKIEVLFIFYKALNIDGLLCNFNL
jgi:hypothetical protein